MDFKLKKKDKPKFHEYSKEDLELARAFAKKAYREFGVFIKSIVLFGSAARREELGQGDVDVLVVVDDVTYALTAEAVEAYRIIMQNHISEVSERIHLTTMKFTNFWDYARNGDPVAVNILRDGVALIDTGFFDPMQLLLYQGRIRPSHEAVWTYFARAPNTLHNSKWHVMQGTIDLYWAVIDAAHAALMKAGEIPPSPSHVADYLDKLAGKGLIKKRYAGIMRDFYKVSKDITHRNIKSITGPQYDQLYLKAKDFIDEMRRFIKKK